MEKLIKLSSTHYIVVDDSEIKEKDWFYFKIDNIVDIVQVESKFHLEKIKKHKENKKVTHSTQPELLGIGWMQSVKPLLLSEVEELVNGYSVEKMCEVEAKRLHSWEKHSDTDIYNQLVYEDAKLIEIGFKTYQELVKDKVFTIEDIRQILYAFETYEGSKIYVGDVFNDVMKQFIPKTEWDITIDENNKITLL